MGLKVLEMANFAVNFPEQQEVTMAGDGEGVFISSSFAQLCGECTLQQKR